MANPWPLPPPPSSPPMHGWRGASGRLYWFSIYSLGSIPGRISQCVYVFARPRHDPAQCRDPLYIGEKGDTDRFDHHEKLQPALALGGTELHVHFTSRSQWERLDIETDLRNQHWTPLNLQRTRAPEPVNALSGLASFGMAPARDLFGMLGAPSPSSAESHSGGIPGPGSALHPQPAMGIHPGNLLVDPIQPYNLTDLLGLPLGMQPASGGIPSSASALRPQNSLLDALEPQNRLSGLFTCLPGTWR